MAEYIERDAARPDVFCVGVSCQDCPFLKSPLYGGCRIDEFISSVPTADVRPVRRGKWTSVFDIGTVCNQCGYDIEEHGFDVRTDGEPNYCPNCGARMEGE